MRKSAVVREVLKCPECNHVQKPNPSQKLFTEAADTVDPDYENEMNFVMLNDAPFCMALNCPSQNSVWFNQSGNSVFQFLMIWGAGVGGIRYIIQKLLP